jgi:glycine cleavage system aminomethyltransferase T/glycine/D-amino acid oxidase-like deaminating enzyme
MPAVTGPGAHDPVAPRSWGRTTASTVPRRYHRFVTNLPTHAGIVVIGGGAIGTSIAYHLAKLGRRDVVLLERRRLTAGTTWHAAGLITSAGIVHETLLWSARRTRELCLSLEAETGQSTGFRACGHIHVATSPGRLDGLRRDVAFARGFGIDNVEISPREFAELCPAARTDDVLAGFLVADEGRANPADLTMAYAKGARAGGVTIAEGVTVTGFSIRDGRVVGVRTDHGDISVDRVVIAAGMWSRQLGELAGVSIPLQAAEHYYLLTDAVPWAHPDFPVVEIPDDHGYYREEGGGILVGLFEPKAAAWSLDRIPDDVAFASLPPDWDRCGPFLDVALGRFPSLRDVGVRQFFCGPESFTSDNGMLLGETPEVDGLFVATGMNSLGILLSGGIGAIMAEWLATDRIPEVDLSGLHIDRTHPYEATRPFRRERTVELLGTLFGDASWPNWSPRTARGVRRSVIHDRLVAAGAHFTVASGWEFPEWFAPPDEYPEPPSVVHGWGRDASFPLQAAEHRAVREAVGTIDMSLMGKFEVAGPDAERVLNRICCNDVAVEPGRLVYTPWVNEGGGFVSDLTVTRLAWDRYLVVATDTAQRRVPAWIRRHTEEGDRVGVVDATSATTLFTVQGPRSRELLAGLSSADFSNEGFPYLTAKPVDIGYAPVLAMRVTYVGELGYELHVPTEFALTVYETLMEAGTAVGHRLFGLGAMSSLRIEKAYRDMGIDIDNSDTPLDAGLGFTIAWDKPGGFVGRDALLRAREIRPPRRRFVQFLLTDPEPLLWGEEPVFLDGRRVGHIRAGAYGHTLGAAVGLGMVEDEDGLSAERIAQGSFEIEVSGRRSGAVASLRPLYDPDRRRILA